MSLSTPIADSEIRASVSPSKGPPETNRFSNPSPSKAHRPSSENESQLNDSQNSDETVFEILAESNHKTAFLAKTSLLLVVTCVAWTAVLAWTVNDLRNSKTFYRSLNGEIMGWVLFVLSLVIKVMMGLIGRKMRSFLNFAFLVDLVCSSLAVMCLYFFFETKWQDSYLFYGIYVFIFAVGFLSTSVGLVLGTLMTRGSKPILSFLVMLICNVGGIGYFYLKTDSTLLRASKLSIFIVFFLVVDLYLAFEIRQFLKYRSHKFFTTDVALAYFCLWTDWFSFFWIDKLNNSQLVKKLRRKGKAKQLEAAKHSKERKRESKIRKLSATKNEIEIGLSIPAPPPPKHEELSEGPVSNPHHEISVRASELDNVIEP